MPNYIIVDTNQYSTSSISSDMFGANLVTTYDYEFADSGELTSLLDGLEISTLRFPGGGVTEGVFCEASFITGNWSASSHTNYDGNTQNLTPMADFFEIASEIGADVQLVVPTRVAFAQSAGQALAAGNFGERSELNPEYLDQMRAFLDQAFLDAEASGVEITRFEIGNEFWGSGEMTAAEYGTLAAELTIFLNDEYPGIDIIAQVVSSTNRFSPLSDREVFLEPDGNGDYIVHLESEVDGNPPSSWTTGTMPGSGNALAQTSLIAEAFAQTPPVHNF